MFGFQVPKIKLFQLNIFSVCHILNLVAVSYHTENLKNVKLENMWENR